MRRRTQSQEIGVASSERFVMISATPMAGVTAGCDIEAIEQLEMVRGTAVAVLLQCEAGEATGVLGLGVGGGSSGVIGTPFKASQASDRSEPDRTDSVWVKKLSCSNS